MQNSKKTKLLAFSSITQMNDIKQYKPLALVFYIDGNGNRNALPLDDSKVEAFKQTIENQKMVQLEGIVINTFDIKEIRPANKTSEIEKYFYSRDYQERAYITERVRHRVNNPKANVLEQLSELWSEKAINMMQGWLNAKDNKPVEQGTTQKIEMSEQEKEFIKQKFTEILSKYTK